MVEKRASVAEQLIDKLLLHIEDNHLGPGDRMPSEKEICETYHVGRSSVREAYKAMQSRGLVVTAQGKGVFVGNKIDLGVLESTPFGNVKMQVQDYMDVRVAIEIASVRLAIQRATPEQIQSLQEIQEGFRQSIAIENTWLMAEKDEQFHTKIAEITGNPLLIQVQAIVADYFRNFRVRSFRVAENRDHAVNPHNMIIQAFLSRNEDLGVLIMQQHLAESFSDFIGNLENHQE